MNDDRPDRVLSDAEVDELVDRFIDSAQMYRAVANLADKARDLHIGTLERAIDDARAILNRRLAEPQRGAARLSAIASEIVDLAADETPGGVVQRACMDSAYLLRSALGERYPDVRGD